MILIKTSYIRIENIKNLTTFSGRRRVVVCKDARSPSRFIYIHISKKVSCPGVWLCQDGRVSLSVFALGTSYQTCSLPPMFPLMFKDAFYFRKRFQESCALNNICCLLKDETIYCELVQWCNDCSTGECTILAQYLGALNDVLFPPNVCSTDGVDLLMRRSKEFPGILSPKIEVATKVRIDEVWNQPFCGSIKATPCQCKEEAARQRQVCHSAQYHRTKCYSSHKRPPSATKPRSRSRSRSSGSRSCCSLTPVQPDLNVTCRCPNPAKPKSPRRRSPNPPRKPRLCPEYSVYNVEMNDNWIRQDLFTGNTENHTRSTNVTDRPIHDRDTLQKTILESRYIEEEIDYPTDRVRRIYKSKISPCVCQICKRYHELFHSNKS